MIPLVNELHGMLSFPCGCDMHRKVQRLVQEVSEANQVGAAVLGDLCLHADVWRA